MTSNALHRELCLESVDFFFFQEYGFVRGNDDGGKQVFKYSKVLLY